MPYILIPMNDSTQSRTTLLRLIDQCIADIDTGLLDADLSDLLRIKAALDADRPTGDMVMQVIFNAFTFLHKEFSLQTEDEFAVIMHFLESFYKYTQESLLEKSSTYKEGLAMEIGDKETITP